MRRVIVTLGTAVALLACAPSKEVTPEDLLKTFQTSRPAVDVRAAALDILVAEGFRILGDDEVVRAALRHIPAPSPSSYYRPPVYFTVVLVKSRDSQDSTAVTVEAYRALEDPDVRAFPAGTSDEAHWCETVAEKLKTALGEQEM